MTCIELYKMIVKDYGRFYWFEKRCDDVVFVSEGDWTIHGYNEGSWEIWMIWKHCGDVVFVREGFETNDGHVITHAVITDLILILKDDKITVYLPIMAPSWFDILTCVRTRMSGGAIYPRQTQPFCGRKLCLDNCGHGNNSNLLSAVPWPDVSCWWVIDVWLLQIYVM